MSLLNLLHKNVIIKFADAAEKQFNPEASYVFRLTGVDAMGFLQLQNLKSGSDTGHETASEPYWINKDLIREIHELNLANEKGTLYSSGQATKSQVKLPAKTKASPKQKPAVN